MQNIYPSNMKCLCLFSCFKFASIAIIFLLKIKISLFLLKFNFSMVRLINKGNYNKQVNIHFELQQHQKQVKVQITSF
jgi:hypothetical protein